MLQDKYEEKYKESFEYDMHIHFQGPRNNYKTITGYGY